MMRFAVANHEQNVMLCRSLCLTLFYERSVDFVYDNQCHTQYESKCSDFTDEVCNVVKDRQCNAVSERKWTTQFSPVCETVKEKLCTTVNDRQCRTVNVQDCNSIPYMNILSDCYQPTMFHIFWKEVQNWSFYCTRNSDQETRQTNWRTSLSSSSQRGVSDISYFEHILVWWLTELFWSIFQKTEQSWWIFGAPL